MGEQSRKSDCVCVWVAWENFQLFQPNLKLIIKRFSHDLFWFYVSLSSPPISLSFSFYLFLPSCLLLWRTWNGTHLKRCVPYSLHVCVLSVSWVYYKMPFLRSPLIFSILAFGLLRCIQTWISWIIVVVIWMLLLYIARSILRFLNTHTETRAANCTVQHSKAEGASMNERVNACTSPVYTHPH